MQKSKVIFIGDIHGCLQELIELLGKCNYNPLIDRVILLGDLVDRGPDSPGVIRFARENNLEAIMGNHDDKHYRWHRNVLREKSDSSFKNKMLPFHPVRMAEHLKLTEEDHNWIANLPFYKKLTICNKDYIAVHAGFLPYIPIEKQDKSVICRVGYLHKDTKKMLRSGPGYTKPADSIFWTEIWNKPEHVVYGHIVHSLENPRIDYKDGFGTCYGIDCGAPFGGRLTALMVYNEVPLCEIIQVQVNKVYTSTLPQED